MPKEKDSGQQLIDEINQKVQQAVADQDSANPMAKYGLKTDTGPTLNAPKPLSTIAEDKQVLRANCEAEERSLRSADLTAEMMAAFPPAAPLASAYKLGRKTGFISKSTECKNLEAEDNVRKYAHVVGEELEKQKKVAEFYKDPFSRLEQAADPEVKEAIRTELRSKIEKNLNPFYTKKVPQKISGNESSLATKNKVIENLRSSLGLNEQEVTQLIKAIEKNNRESDSQLKQLNQHIIDVSKKIDKQQEILEIQRAWSDVTAGAQGLCAFGERFKVPALTISGKVIDSAIQVQKVVAAVAGLPAALALIGPMAALGPVGMMGGAVAAIFSIFSASGPNPHQLILDQISKLGEQLHDLHLAISQGFKDTHRTQMQILEQLNIGFASLELSLKTEVAGLSVQFHVATEKICSAIAYTQRFLEMSEINKYLQPLARLIAQDVKRANTAELRNINLELIGWMETHSYNKAVNGGIINELDIESNPIPAEKRLAMYQDIINRPGESLSGSLSWMIKPYDIFKKIKESKNFPNPIVLQQALQAYIEAYKANPSADVDLDNKKIDQIIAYASANLQVLNDMRDDNEFFNFLLTGHKKILNELVDAIKVCAHEHSQKELARLRTQRPVLNISKQTDNINLDILKNAETFCSQQFAARTLHHLPYTELGKVPNSSLDGFGDLKVDTVLHLLQSKLPAEILASEYLMLKQYLIRQSEPMNGLEIKYYKAFDQDKNQVTDENNLRFDNDKFDCTHKDHDKDQAKLKWYNPPMFLSAQSWKLPLELYDASNNTTTIKFNINSMWEHGDWKDTKAPILKVNTESWVYTKPFDLYYEQEKRVYCSHTVNKQSEEALKNHFQRIVNRWLLQWSADDSRLKTEHEDIFTAEHKQEIKNEIDKYLTRQRKLLAADLASGSLKNKGQKEFANLLIKLDISYSKILAYIVLAGKNCEDPSLDHIPNSKKILAELKLYAHNTESICELNLPSLPMNTEISSIQMDLSNITEMTLDATHPRSLFAEVIRMGTCYKMYKLLVKGSIIQVAQDPSLVIRDEYQRQLTFFANENRAYYKSLIGEVTGYEEARFKFAQDRALTVPVSTNAEFEKLRSSIIRWGVDLSTKDVAVGVNNLATIISQSTAWLLEQNEQTQLHLPTELNLALQRAWFENMKALIDIGKVLGLKVNDNLKILNPHMWADSCLRFVDMVAYPFYLETMLEFDVKEAYELLEIGFGIKQLISSIRMSKLMFTKIFDRYLSVLNLLDGKNCLIEHASKTLSLSDEQIYADLRDSKKDIQNKAQTLFIQLETLGLLLRSYLLMAFAYDENLGTEHSACITALLDQKKWMIYLDPSRDKSGTIMEKIERHRQIILQEKNAVLRKIDEQVNRFNFERLLSKTHASYTETGCLILTYSLYGTVYNYHWDVIQRYISSKKTIKYFSVPTIQSENSSTALDKLFYIVTKANNIDHLDLFCRVTVEELEKVSKILPAIKKLTIRNLWCTIDGEAGYIALLKFIKQVIDNTNIEYLNIDVPERIAGKIIVELTKINKRSTKLMLFFGNNFSTTKYKSFLKDKNFILDYRYNDDKLMSIGNINFEREAPELFEVYNGHPALDKVFNTLQYTYASLIARKISLTEEVISQEHTRGIRNVCS